MTASAARQIGDVVRVESDRLFVDVAPDSGGDILAVVEKAGSRDVLWKSPWARRTAPSDVATSSMSHWIERCPGGWQLLVPNAGAACVVDGVNHGYHGEAALAAWAWAQREDGVALSTELITAPLRVERTLRVEEDALVVSMEILASGTVGTDFMAVEHAGFGSDLLAGPVTIATDARTVATDDAYDPPGNRFRPGHRSEWPHVRGAAGSSQDLRHPQDGTSGLCHLEDFEVGRAEILRDDRSLGVELTWDARSLPTAWLWQELKASPGWPWFGRARVIGIEPATSYPGAGLAVARDAGHAVRLEAGQTWSTWVRLRLLSDPAEIDARIRRATHDEEG